MAQPPLEKDKGMKIQDFLDYEIRSSWWASLVWWKWGQDFAARYFAWKTKRKYNRYLDSRLDKAMAIRQTKGK